MAIGNLQELIPAIFTGPNGERLTPEQIAQRQQIAQSLIGRATDTSPDAGGWASVLTKGLLGFQSGRDRRAADNAIKANAESSQASISSMLGSLGLGGGAGFPASVASGASPTSGAATGTVMPPQLTPLAEGSEWLQYANQGATRNLPINEKLSGALSFLPEMGVTMKVVSGGQVGKGEKGGRVGSTRHDHGNAADVDFYIGDRKLTPKNEQDRAILAQIVQRGKAAGITGWGEGDDYMGSGRVHLGFGTPGVWGAGGKGANAPEWLTNAYNTPYTPQQAIQAIAPIAQVAPQEGADTSNFSNRWDAGSSVAAPALEEVQVQPKPVVAESQSQYTPGQVVTGSDGQTYQNVEQLDGSYALSRYNPSANQPSVSPSLLAQNDMMLGGALSPSGSSPVAQALSGAFPSAPSADRAPVTSQPFQMPAQSQSGGINPAVIQALSSPYISNQGRQVASLLLGRQLDASDPMKQAELQLRQAQTQAALRKASNPLSDETFFGNPIAIQGPDGQIKYGQIGNKGTFRPIQLGEGQTFAPPTRTVDTGTEIIQMTQNGEVISRTPKQNREAAAQTAGGQVEGKTEAERRIAAPADIQTGQNTISLINKIKNHPGLKMGTGLGSYANAIPGTPGYDFQNLVDQAKSGAFLSAIQQMRGMGSLSNAEGDAATRAVNRINTATSTDAFLDALSDYQTIVQQGIERAQRNINEGSITQQGGGSKRLKFNPATGELE